MDTTTINVGMTDVGSLLDGNFYKVPNYQRHYSWDDEALRDFWNDLVDVVEGQQDTHFIGQIVTYINNGVQEVIDGQQRLTTISILMAAILHKSNIIWNSAENLSDNPRGELTKLKLDIKDLLRWNEAKPSLRLQPYKTGDNSIDDYFRGIFEGKLELNQNNKDITPVKNIKDAFENFEDCIDSYWKINEIKDNPQKISVLVNVFNSLRKKFILSRVYTVKKEDAFIIYQSLNSKGKQLEASELIKSHIMAQVSNADEMVREEVQQKWDKIATSFGNDNKEITKFIRVYWTATNRLVTGNQLFRSIATNVLGTSGSLSFLNDLINVVDYYVAVIKGLKTKKDKELFQDSFVAAMLAMMHKLGAKLYYPLLFSLILRGIDIKSEKIIIYKILSIFVRHRSICNYGTSSLETGYAKVAQDVWKQKIVTDTDIVNELDREMLVGDLEVQNAFKGLSREMKNGAKKWTITYILYELYKQYGEFDGLDMDKIGFDNLSLIHIGSEEEVSSDYFNYIGNYALIESTIRDKYGEKDVIRSLNESRYALNKDIANFMEQHRWDVNDILNRQEEMSIETTQIW
ncbi:DUF262 domain-containing protein [Apilactobacillus kunkeei]|uniref:DUF262 domain-containing protein n=1 Tax=Apilactobacillus kunkeei TaxID=148814 RepID=UPI0011284426|nr:DUF262 domain-containing protein [Apilactobacillus kunkeei]TPR51139.1 DUF262 domain-containing protein [Apilactobacillus kunkeei]